MIRSILFYTIGALGVLLGKVLTYILAPILALPWLVVEAEESETTGYPSLIKDEPREFLVRPLRWLQTHDAPLDEYYYAGYYKGKWTERFKDNKWFMRVCWLWRNPAYGIAHALGYSQKGMKLFYVKDQWSLRNSGLPNTTFVKAVNNKGQKGWLYFKQIPYGKKKCLELYFGWKLFRRDPDEKCMLVFRVKPFKSL